MDAAITAHLCVEVVNCHSTGLGGGGFLLAYEKGGSATQGDTVLVPGVLKGLEMGHKKMGKLPWRDLFEEPIKLASEGFLMHEALAHAISKKKDYILANLGLREVFAPEGYILTLGQRVKRTKLAETFRKIADSGSADIFYKGEFAMDIVKDIQEAGGSITMEDLKGYKAFIRKPISTRILNMTMYGVPPPASSVTVAMMLKLMESSGFFYLGFQWTKRTLKEKPGLFYHQMVEAMKFANAPTTFLGDPKYVKNTSEIVKNMLDDQYINEIFQKIDSKSHRVEYYGPFSDHHREYTGTSHISVVGPDGDAVAITSSINAHFGARIMSRRLGFIYNNELSDFSDFWPKVYNFSTDGKIPGKRPLSKVSPLIFTNDEGEVEIVVGAAGGFFIPSALSSTLSFFLFLHDNLTTAIARPRIHCQLFPPTVVVEQTFPIDIIPLLNQYDHHFVTNDTYSATGQSNAIMGVIQAIARDKDGDYIAVCDYRKGGLPAGY
ncbi:Gamma-glutamyltranspeptidase 1 [Thelohanellus kitauei]|uniref:Gamma-glutamyltranspeptidase 1 n=1 Tax=Thelohanellus kitauei TaxID=669202 RepID=A0A0C2I5B9_THEKT|nr:Gamma-glutamyltranspeptidase 1 [Thelohanellus kitauei]